MQILAIRHGSTDYNEKQLINPVDAALSSKGFKQIEILIGELAEHKFTVVYTSSMNRAIQTAVPIAEQYDLPLKKEPRITEVNFGSFEGKDWRSTIPELGLDVYGVMSSCAYDLRPYGGESAEETRARVESFIDDLKKNPDQKPLIVTHGGIIRWLYYLCTGEKVEKVPHVDVHTFDI